MHSDAYYVTYKKRMSLHQMSFQSFFLTPYQKVTFQGRALKKLFDQVSFMFDLEDQGVDIHSVLTTFLCPVPSHSVWPCVQHSIIIFLTGSPDRIAQTNRPEVAFKLLPRPFNTWLLYKPQPIGSSDDGRFGKEDHQSSGSTRPFLFMTSHIHSVVYRNKWVLLQLHHFCCTILYRTSPYHPPGRSGLL